MDAVEGIVLAALIGLFLYLRAIKPWFKKVDADIDPTQHDKPIKEFMVSEKLISLTTLVIVPGILYCIEKYCPHNRQEDVLKKFLLGEWLFLDAVQIIKMIIVRPRPNAIALEGVSGGKNQFGKVDPRLESRQSFPSAHAFLGSFSATFLVIYLQHKLHPKRYLFPSAVQFFIFNAGLIPGFTQGLTYWHHWSDVAAGFGTGICAAYASYYHLV